MIARFTLIPSQSLIYTHKAAYIGGSFWAMLSIEPRILAFQLLEIIWPELFCANYGYNSISFITLPMALAALAVLLVIVVILSRKNAAFAFGAIFFVLAILPTSNLVPIYNPTADRYFYLPLAGICIALAALLCRMKIPTKKWFWPAIIISVGVYIFFGSFTIQRIHVWHDNLSLWQDTTTKNPYSFIGYCIIGSEYYEVRAYDKALVAFTRACQLDPNNAESLAGLAITLDAMGLTAKADETYRKLISLNKDYADYDSLTQIISWEPHLAKKIQIIADRVKQP